MAKIGFRLSKEQQQVLALAVILLGGGGFAYYKYFWQPMAVKIEQRRLQIEEIEGKIGKAMSHAARLAQIQTEIARLNDQAVEAEQRLPKKKDLPAVIVTVSGLMRKNNVQLQSFSTSGQTLRDYFVEVPYALIVRGAYHDIGRLFAGFALEQRIFNVRNVSYGAQDPEGRLAVTFTLVSYQYKG